MELQEKDAEVASSLNDLLNKQALFSENWLCFKEAFGTAIG